MLRNTSRAVTSKQALMADHSSQSSATQNYARPIPSFFGSPSFKAFTTKGLPETDAVKSPTSILDHKPFFPFVNPFGYDLNQPKSPKPFSPNNKHHSPENLESKGIGLAIIDTLKDRPIKDKSSCDASKNKMVLFGTELRVQIPQLPPSLVSPTISPKSPTDFGIKTKNSHLSAAFGSPTSGIHVQGAPRVIPGCLLVTEMELSEDYTCVISHGPNPKTTHIFDNCVVESYCSVSDKPKSAPESFLSFCHTCKKNLEQKIDIYIYKSVHFSSS
ncbi:hypothetical protein DITRI_Ditri13aG0091900 [Diplodiscus trichospermus]